LIIRAFKKSCDPPDTLINFYRIGKILGKGAFGKVTLGMHKLSRKLVAIKSMNKTILNEDSQKRKIFREVTILKKFRHPHVVKLLETFETEKHVLFVMEMCAGGDLLNYVRKRRKLKEPIGKYIFK
jgi:serine/threonine protein kinase